MKAIKIVLLSFVFFTSSTLIANTAEVWLKIYNSNNSAMATRVDIFVKNGSGYIYFDHGYSTNYWRQNNSNAYGDVGDNSSAGSTSSYTDYSYVHSSGTGSDKLLHYDVRYYANGNYASPSFMAIYGEEVEYLPKHNNNNDIVDNTNYNVITEYDISSFPNPFNPTTNIYFKVKEPGFVSIKVYDMLGKEVATLLNEEKPNGDFVVKFDGSKLASGIYILTMQVNDYYKSQKLLLTK